jgi:hypothetical protein
MTYTPSGPKPVGARRKELLARVNAQRLARGNPISKGGGVVGNKGGGDQRKPSRPMGRPPGPMPEAERELRAQKLAARRAAGLSRVVVANDEWHGFLYGRRA